MNEFALPVEMALLDDIPWIDNLSFVEDIPLIDDILMGDFINLTQDISQWGLTDVFIRLLLAFLIGGFIGFDRGIKRRGAGIKTHTLVCLSAALVMLTGQYIYMNFAGATDVARLGAQVINGIGFLGAGTIIVTGRHQIRGLTTASSIWACACIGLAIGIGFIQGVLVIFLLMLLVLHIMPRIDMAIYRRSKHFDLYIEFDDTSDITNFIKYLRSQNFQLSSIDIAKPKVQVDGVAIFTSIEVADKEKRKECLKMLNDVEGVRFIEEAS